MEKRSRKLKKTQRSKIPNLHFENILYNKGFTNIAGVDEVGRGAWAGPLIAAAVILKHKKIYKIRDSKLLNFQKRHILSKKIKKESRSYAIGKAQVWEIEKYGLQPATYLAFKRALKKLKIKPNFILIDAYKIPNYKTPIKALKKGDLICLSISAASILAKDYRDKLMIKFHKIFPKYRFDLHKGYGTKLHQQKLQKYKICQIHRKNFKPIRQFIAKK